MKELIAALYSSPEVELEIESPAHETYDGSEDREVQHGEDIFDGWNMSGSNRNDVDNYKFACADTGVPKRDAKDIAAALGRGSLTSENFDRACVGRGLTNLQINRLRRVVGF